jgi:hypothetical protein
MADEKAVLQCGDKTAAEFLIEFFGCEPSELLDEPDEVIDLEVENDPE